MSRWLEGDLQGLMLPADLERLRDAVSHALAQGRSVERLYQALAELAPPALMDLTLGPRAPAHPEAVRAALGVAASLEGLMTPSALYRRLLSLCPALGAEILAAALRRHAAARWLLRFAESAQETPGAAQLAACREHPAYVSLCFAHAEAGHAGALHVEARAGRPEPAAALLSMGLAEQAVQAAIDTLRASPGAPVVPWLAAAGGPGLDDLLRPLAQAPLPDAARRGLERALAPFPAALADLRRGAPSAGSG